MSAMTAGRLPLGKCTSAVFGAVVSLPIMGLGVGTGGAFTLDYLRDRGERGYKYIDIEQRRDLELKRAGLSLSAQLACVRKIIPGAVTEFARALHVSRQAIYDWRGGKPVAEENAARIRDLFAAANELETSGLAITAQLMRRRISVEGGFFDYVAAGRSAGEAARALIEIVRIESRQRSMMQHRFGASAPATRNDLDDVGAPRLKEEG